MDILKNPYYKATTNVLAVAGQSSLQQTWKKFLIHCFIVSIMISFIVAQIAGLIQRLDNVDMVLECVPPATYASISAIVYLNNSVQVKQINVVLFKMQKDWDTLTLKHDADVLHKYGRRYRSYIYLFYVLFFGNISVYILSDFFPYLIGSLKHNAPEGNLFLVEFGIDAEKYKYLIILHGYLAGAFCTIGILCGDILLFMFLEHACALFEIIGLKLTALIEEGNNFRNRDSLQRTIRKEIKICVAMHKKSLIFVSDVQAVFSTAYLFVFGLYIVLLSISGVQSVLSVRRPNEAIRFGCHTSFQIFHIFLLTIPTQHLMDISLSLTTSIYNTNWYHLPTEAQKLLLIIMRRSCQPSTFIVGKIFTPSLQFFTAILQTSMSYFTVLMSVRG